MGHCFNFFFFFFNICDEKNIYAIYTWNTLKNALPQSRGVAAVNLTGTCCSNKITLYVCIYCSTNEWGSISENLLSLSKFQYVCTTICNCPALPEQWQVLV